MKYRYDLYNGGVKVAELTGVISSTIAYFRNDPKKMTLTHLGNRQESAILENLIEGSELRIYRQGEYVGATMNLIWAGEIISAERKVNERNEKLIIIEADHWASRFFRSRFVDATFTAEDESDIAWGLINATQTDTQSGFFTADQVDCGFTAGTLESGTNIRTITYSDQEVLLGIQQLADMLDLVDPQLVRGFFFGPDISHNTMNTFDYMYNYGVVRDFKYTNSQIREISRTKTLRDYANQVLVTGQIGIRTKSSSVIQESLDFYKLRQAFVPKNNISDVAQLQRVAELELPVRVSPAVVYNVELVENDYFTGLYGIGDTIGIQFTDDEGFLDLDITARVYGMELNFDSVGKERVTLTLAETRPVSTAIEPMDRLVHKVEQLGKRQIILEKF